LGCLGITYPGTGLLTFKGAGIWLLLPLAFPSGVGREKGLNDYDY